MMKILECIPNRREKKARPAPPRAEETELGYKGQERESPPMGPAKRRAHRTWVFFEMP